jgi:hypothetical protein
MTVTESASAGVPGWPTSLAFLYSVAMETGIGSATTQTVTRTVMATPPPSSLTARSSPSTPPWPMMGCAPMCSPRP